MTKILGIDPGYDRLGYALVDGDKLETLGCFETDRKKSYEERPAGPRRGASQSG